jgi:hypothetical protein
MAYNLVMLQSYRQIKILVLLALLAATGCAPVVMHGPRVEPGGTAGLTGGWRAGLCEEGCTAGLVPPIGAYINYGLAPYGPDGLAYQFSTLIPLGLFIPASHVDFYVQAPARRDLVYGGGLSISFGHVMPYAQIGNTRTDGRGWYTTQGVVLAAYRPEPDVYLEGGRDSVFEGVDIVYWSPGLAYGFGWGSVYVSGAFGRERTAEYDPRLDRFVTTGSRPVLALLGGVSLRTRPLFRLF